MAYIKLGTTKSANRLVSYCEKRADISTSINCTPLYAKAQLRVTRELWGKNDKIQAHHVIQSFKPNETTSEQANKIGLQLAEKLFKGYEVAIYTHTDKEHIHNHIVVNSVNFENGKKLHLHGKKALELVRGASDELCLQNGLSLPIDKSPISYTLAEKGIIEKGGISWKDELRQIIDFEKVKASSFDSFKSSLQENYNITVTERGKNIVYSHPEQKKNVRGTKLGADYEKGNIENVINGKINSKREITGVKPSEQGRTGKQPSQGEFDGIHSTIRGIEDGAKQFSPTHREKLREEQKLQREEFARMEREQREKAERTAREQRNARESHKIDDWELEM